MFSAATQRKLDAMPRSACSARVILAGRCMMRGHAAISAIKFFSDGNSKFPKPKKREKGNGFTSSIPLSKGKRGKRESVKEKANYYSFQN